MTDYNFLILGGTNNLETIDDEEILMYSGSNNR